MAFRDTARLLFLSNPSIAGASVSGRLDMPLCLFRLATFDVLSELLSAVGVAVFVSALLSTVFCAPVASTRHESDDDVLGRHGVLSSLV